MKNIHWFETKQLDRVTNFSTEIEVLKTANSRNINMQYYCTFFKEKNYYGLPNNINYLGFFKSRYIKAIEFKILVILKAVLIVLKFKSDIVMVNQDLVLYVLPACVLNRIFRKNNKFVVDIRTTPTNPETFDSDMKRFHNQFSLAVKFFNGFSFITPFMEKYIMDRYDAKKPTVTWSSGVDLNLFDSTNYSVKKSTSFMVFYHGGISISRGNLTLIKATEILVNKGYDITLLQVGICVNGEIESYIIDKNISNWCKLLPPLPLSKMPEYIFNSDLPVLPFPYFDAWRVSSPIKLMEYLAIGKKVLAPNLEAFTDVFEDKEELIFYFDSENKNQINEISNRLKDIIDLNLVNKADVSSKCRNFVMDRYTWEKQAKKLIDFVLQL
ncbi:hypothetical protein [uncultured Winogradskyella sp.]|uniref:hypothetical protein n=1 Tax=uncultured Winogradskyella sp. TaxID=395353 RepID=UPI0030D90234